MERRHNKLFLCSILAFFSSSCPSTSTIIIGVASGELQPSPHRRLPSLAFFPRDSRINHHGRRRKSQHGIVPSTFDVLQLRCGGADDESNSDGGGEDIDENNSDGSSQQPVVDISAVENEESSSTEEGIEVNDAETDLSPSGNGSESGSTQPDDEVADDDGEVKNDSDLTESEESQEESQEELSSSEDALNDADQEATAEDVESSDETDISESQEGKIPNSELLEKQSQLLSSASDRRAEGKTFHDAGSLADAAEAFREAAFLLDEAILMAAEVPEADKDDNAIAVERATCRLHEALCLLKDGRPRDCVEACTDVLEDGVTVIPLDGDEEENAEEEGDGESKPAVVVKIIPAPSDTAAHSAYGQTIPPQIRARAHHRRAKARLALEDLDGALEDARSAAFMGDKNAVQFYGRLMREGSGAASGDTPNIGGFGASPFGLPGDGAASGESSNPFLEGLLGGMSGSSSNPLMPSGAGSNDFSSSLLSSLLSSGATDGSGGGGNPLGLMGDLFAPQGNSNGGKSKRRKGGKKSGGGGMDTLAKSVLSSLLKRIEDEQTHETICNYLHSTNTQQIMQYASMAGVPMKEESAKRLVKFAGGVTPKGISKSISKVKRGISIVKTIRKVLKVIDKYKAYIIVAVLCYWIRSSILEPYPVSKKQAKKLAQKAALSLLIMPPMQHQRSSRTIVNICGGVARALSSLYLSGSENMGENVEVEGSSKLGIEEELERLQNQLTWIEALEERNKAQLDSFVDKEDQWESLDEDERELLSSKDSVIQQMEDLAEQLVMLFMGQKMREG